MLSDDELTVMRDAYSLRSWEGESELWFGIVECLLPQAEALVEQGLLERTYCRECSDLHWRISGEGTRLIETHNMLLASQN